MVAALVAGALFTKQLLWTPIPVVNLSDIASNRFKMSNAHFAGTDKNGDPFTINAAVARQEYDTPDIVYMDSVSGTITRRSDGKRVTNNVSANAGQYNRKLHTVKLLGNVKINSSDGNTLLTKELVVKL